MFGGSIGGPVKKSANFFFGDYQGVRQKTGSAVQTTVPTALAHTTCTSGANCNLSDYLNPASTTAAHNFRYSIRRRYAGHPRRVVRCVAENIIPVGDCFRTCRKPDKRHANAKHGQWLHHEQLCGVWVRYFQYRPIRRARGHASEARISTRSGATPDSIRLLLGLHISARRAVGGLERVVLPELTMRWIRAWLQAAITLSVPLGSPTFASVGSASTSTKQGPDYDQPLGNELGIPNANVGDLSLNGGLPQFQVDVLSNGSTTAAATLEFGTSAAQYLQTENQFQVMDNWSHQLGKPLDPVWRRSSLRHEPPGRPE